MRIALLNRFTRLACVTGIVVAAGFSVPVSAQNFGFYINIGPPEPRYEVMPQARRGYTWNEGHWEWRAQRHIWIKGNWLRNRQGYVYQQPHWEQRDRDQRWALQRGKWNREQPQRHEDQRGRSEQHRKDGGKH